MLQFGPYFGDLDREIERFIEQTQRHKRPAVQFGGQGWRPLVDVFETAEMVVAVVELAGVDESQLELTVQDKALLIRGQRGQASEHQPHSYYILEIHHGPFERLIPLPAAVDAERTQASIRNGMLEVCLPKQQAQHIAVTVTRLETDGGR
ncbi:MAG TPA: Hsp20/alpha crystallin family protein [Chloroflexota bacterium]|nr:Hsp20/alpha crystallin family protein [Chloroflexota bacterium]